MVTGNDARANGTIRIEQWYLRRGTYHPRATLLPNISRVEGHHVAYLNAEDIAECREDLESDPFGILADKPVDLRL
jgi:hypothetical protein